MAPKPLADLVEDCLAPALAAQGFAGRSVVAFWPEIVGESLADRTRPLKIDWPRRRNAPGEVADPATLVVRVEGAFALEMQQLGPLVIERVNTHLGWRAVGKLVLKQGPVAPPPAAPRPEPLDPAALARIEQLTTAVADDGLRAALARLGRGVLSRHRSAAKTRLRDGT
jgi:hypothetical protein